MGPIHRAVIMGYYGMDMVDANYPSAFGAGIAGIAGIAAQALGFAGLILVACGGALGPEIVHSRAAGTALHSCCCKLSPISPISHLHYKVNGLKDHSETCGNAIGLVAL